MSPAALRNGLLLSAFLWCLIILACVGCTTTSPYPVPPKRYQGPFNANVQTTNDSVKACRTATTVNEVGPAIACSVSRFIVMPNPCSWPNHELYAELFRHEGAHVNGYPADHPRK